MAVKSFKEMLANAKQRDGYWVEKAKLQFSVELNRLFSRRGKSQKELAGQLGTSSAYITKVFRGDTNFTIETMVKLARAVDGELQIHIVPKQEKSQWYEVLKSQQPHRPKSSDEWIKSNRLPHEKIPTTA